MNESKLSNVTKEELEKLIFGEKLSYEEIGRRYEVSGMVIVYSLPLGKTLLVNVAAESEEAYEFKLINENWLEDRSITPYVGMTLEDAFQELVKAEKIIKSRNVVLRHPLHPSYTRPVYIFGDVRRGGNSVDVMTGEIREE
jgi:hypothetical protein